MDEVHCSAILDLLNRYAEDPMGGGSGLSDYTKKNLIRCLRERSDCRVLIAFSGELPSGLAITFLSFSTFACRPILNIHDLVVASEFRSMGVARELLKSAELIALECGCCKLTLEVLEGNDRARHVYRKFGFQGYELDPEMGRAMFLEKPLSVERL